MSEESIQEVYADLAKIAERNQIDLRHSSGRTKTIDELQEEIYEVVAERQEWLEGWRKRATVPGLTVEEITSLCQEARDHGMNAAHAIQYVHHYQAGGA